MSCYVRCCEHRTRDKVGDLAGLPAHPTQIKHFSRVAGDVPCEQHQRGVAVESVEQRLDQRARKCDHRVPLAATLEKSPGRSKVDRKRTVFKACVDPTFIPPSKRVECVVRCAAGRIEQLSGPHGELQYDRLNDIVDRCEVAVCRGGGNTGERCDVRKSRRWSVVFVDPGVHCADQSLASASCIGALRRRSPGKCGQVVPVVGVGAHPFDDIWQLSYRRYEMRGNSHVRFPG